MDGFAVRADSTHGATKTRPKRLRSGSEGGEGEAVPVDTGNPLPEGMNAVIMIKNTQRVPDPESGGECIEILAASALWQYVRPMGEDMVATELVLPANHKLRPADLGPSPVLVMGR